MASRTGLSLPLLAAALLASASPLTAQLVGAIPPGGYPEAEPVIRLDGGRLEVATGNRTWRLLASHPKSHETGPGVVAFEDGEHPGLYVWNGTSVRRVADAPRDYRAGWSLVAFRDARDRLFAFDTRAAEASPVQVAEDVDGYAAGLGVVAFTRSGQDALFAAWGGGAIPVTRPRPRAFRVQGRRVFYTRADGSEGHVVPGEARRVARACVYGEDWTESYEEARKKAEAEGKFLFMYFCCSDEGYYCKKFYWTILRWGTFLRYARENLVLFLVDFPRAGGQPTWLKEQNAALKAKWKIHAYPHVKILKGDVLVTNAYYMNNHTPGMYVNYLKRLLGQR